MNGGHRIRRRPLSPRGGLLAITSAAVLWGTTGVIVQSVHRDTGLSALSIGFYRLAISTVFLLLVGLRSLAGIWEALRRHPGGLVLAGAALATYQVLYFVGVTAAGVNVATMVSLGVAPVVTAVWESVTRRRLPGTGSMLVTTAAVLGLVLVVAGQRGAPAGPHPVAGVLASLGSGLVYGATAVLGRHLSQRVPSLPMTTVMSGVGTLVLAVPATALGLGLDRLPGATTQGWVVPAGLLYIGVMTTAVAYLLFNAGLVSTASSSAAVLTLCEPLTAAVLAVVILHEPLTGLTIAGAVLLIGSVAVLHLRPEPVPPPGG